MMQSMVPSTHVLSKSNFLHILYHDDVNTKAYVVGKAFNLNTYIVDRGLGMLGIHPPMTCSNHITT